MAEDRKNPEKTKAEEEAKRKAKISMINGKAKRLYDPKRKGKKWTIELTHGGVSYSSGPFATEAEAEEYEKLTSAVDMDVDGLED